MRRRPRVGRLLVLGYEGAIPPEDLFAFAERFGLGGVILFRRNCPDADTVRAAAKTVRQRLLQADPGWRPLIMVDQEGGRVQRIRDGVPALPSARRLGEAGPIEVEERIRQQAEALARLGVDVNLAPVCDVVQEDESGVIGDRSFGADPERAATLVAAHTRGTLNGGVFPCAKHFPGHGAASVDSHLALPRIEKGLRAFEETDLIPFRAAIQAGAPLVMAAHLLCLAVDSRPSTLSSRWLGTVLRGSLGFRGLVISDDMEMGALETLGHPPQVALDALCAGCDLLIYGRTLRPDVDPTSVAEHLERGLSEARFQEAAGRATALWGGRR